MKAPWISYTLLRLLLIVVPLVILLIVVPFEYWPFSVTAAVIIGLCLSYLLLRKQRDAISRDIYERRRTVAAPHATKDDEVEDAAVDATEAPAASEGERGAEGGPVQQRRDAGQL